MALARFQRAAIGAWAQAAGRARGADWWAVAGELAVVVLGILIAFQLDRWSESWRKSRDRELYLERLVEESSYNVVALTTRKEEFDGVTAELRTLVRRMTDPTFRPARAPATDRACRSLQLPAARLQLSAIEEGGGAAAIELAPDSALRKLLHAAVAANRFEERQLETYRGTFQRFGAQLDPHAHWRPRRGAGFSCTFAFEAFAREPGAENLLFRVYRDRVNYARIHTEQIAAQRAIRDRASCLLEDSC